MCKALKKFDDIYFYIPDNKERYIKYSELNPEMDTEDVVWHVNNYLDKEKYSPYLEINRNQS